MTDIIVIGGGIAGLSAAARLSEGASVLVLEAEDGLGYHASGRSAALFEALYGLPPVVALNKASAEYHQPYLTPRGLLLVAGDGDAEQFATDCKSLQTKEISVAEAQGFVPILASDTVKQAAYHEAAFDIDTDRMLQDFAGVVRKSGGQVLTGQKVSEIKFSSGTWIVTCGAETFEAPTLVNAAGAWADRVAVMAGIDPIGLIPHRRSMARLPAPGGHDVSHWPMFMGAGETWYAKPDAGKLLVSPADEDPVEAHDAWADDLVLAEGIARYEACVTETVDRVETNWAGLRTFAPDRVLVLGRDPVTPEFVWCAGQGGYGFQTAPAASRLLSDLVLGRSSELTADTVAAVSPARFSQG